MALSPTIILSPLRINLKSTLTSSTPSTPLSTVTVSYSKTNSSGIESKDKKALLEHYGLDHRQFLSEISPKRNRREELMKTRRGKQVKEEEVTEDKPERTTHRLLQVLGGKAKRKKLLSPKGMDVRPMMEVVKGSAFDILQAAGGYPASLRPGCWLDLYSGTGSVGIEAISRGCSEALYITSLLIISRYDLKLDIGEFRPETFYMKCNFHLLFLLMHVVPCFLTKVHYACVLNYQVHFVEMDPWVVSNVLRPNLEWTGFLDASVIHTVRVEDFLERAEKFVGSKKAFDFISVTPPHTQVDYEILMHQISKSSIVEEDTFIVVEYPLRTKMLDTCGCLVKITDRRFGRTHLAIYGPKWAQKKRK